MGVDTLAETDPSGNTTAEFIYFNGRRIALRDGGGSVFYIFSDHLGSARVITDSTGTVCRDVDYFPYGGEKITLNTCALLSYNFATYERDPESGLDYAIFRYYNSRLGRFMSADPLAGGVDDPQSLNRYAYVLNDPVNSIDPLGLECHPVGDGSIMVCNVHGNSSGGLGFGPNNLNGFGISKTDQLRELTFEQGGPHPWSRPREDFPEQVLTGGPLFPEASGRFQWARQAARGYPKTTPPPRLTPDPKWTPPQHQPPELPWWLKGWELWHNLLNGDFLLLIYVPVDKYHNPSLCSDPKNCGARLMDLKDKEFEEAVALRDSGRVEEALAKFQAMGSRTENPEEKASLLGNEVTCLSILGRRDEAKIKLSMAQQILPNSSPSSAHLDFLDACLSSDLDSPDQALAKFAHLLDRHSARLDTPEYGDLVSQIHLRRARILTHLHRSKDALDALELVQRGDCSDEDLQDLSLYKGICYDHLGNQKRAREEFSRVIAIPLKTDAELNARYRLGVLYFRAGALARAKREFEICEAGSPRAHTPRTDIWEMLAKTCHYLGEHDEASRYERLAKAGQSST